jgi:hypothetical protein
VARDSEADPAAVDAVLAVSWCISLGAGARLAREGLYRARAQEQQP